MNINPEMEVEKITKLSPCQKNALKKLGILTAKDALLHLPNRYQEAGTIKRICDINYGEAVVVYGKILSIKTAKAYRKKIPLSEAVIDDGTGRIRVVWFHQAYIAKKLATEMCVELSGLVSKDKNNRLYLSNPSFKEVSQTETFVPNNLFGENSLPLSPVYPETKGVSSLWFKFFIRKLLKSGAHKKMEDMVPSEILRRYNLPSLESALVFIHSPQKENDALVARKRFAFEEIFFIQLKRQKSKNEYKRNPAFKIKCDDNKLKNFTKRLPFSLTKAQETAIKTILGDLKRDRPMTRLVEGDVGSGKTAVAAAAAYSVINTRPKNQNFGRLEVAYMVPTEILAKQHFESFIKNFAHLNISVGLITGNGCYKFPSKINPHQSTPVSKNQLLKWVAGGQIPILIGTHALIQETVKFKNLALVIIDEQHRFGTNQRSKLANNKKGAPQIFPHLLSMTATPIPRTLALTIYGDLDLTLLDEMPAGRKPVITEIVLPGQRQETYQKIRSELDSGRQMYVICPRIDEPDLNKSTALNIKSVKDEAKRLKRDIFPAFEIGVLHSKLKPKEKDAIMAKFVNGQIKILVATSMVEVGVNVPNATIIVIEGAERFGLAQLHQLRGRVLRSNYQAYCYIFADIKSEKSLERLRALKTSQNGFELAELDLNLRGPGELSGKKQWGISDLGMEAIKNIKMVEAARMEAAKIL